MKKAIYIFIVSFLLIISNRFCFPICSNATTTATVYLTSNKDVIEKGDEVEISLNIKEQKTAAYFVNIYFDETKLEFISGPENVKLDKNKIKIIWYDAQGGSGAKQGELEKIVLKAKEDGLANIVVDGEFFSEKTQLIQTNFESLRVQIGREKTILEQQAKEEQGDNTQTDNANLQSLRIDIDGMVPNFETNIFEYDLTITNDINNIEVLAIAENPNSKVEITGNTGLKEGLNFIKVKIISEDETQDNEYVINVTKISNPELANANLEILAIENNLLIPPFDSHTTQYKTEISNTITKLNIFAVPENEEGKVEIAGNEDFKEGNNKISITVTAPNGFTKRVYEVNVYKRNIAEEEEYKKEQEELEEKLKHAYEIEKISTENTILSDQEENRKYFIIGIICFILLTAVSGFSYYKKKHK